MIISSCPRCQEQYRVPMGSLPDDAYAQCPWCRETFPLDEVLRRLPPVLKVIRADGQPIEFHSGSANEYSTTFPERTTFDDASSGFASPSQKRGLANRDAKTSFGRQTGDDEEFDDSLTYEADVDFDRDQGPMRIEASADDELDPEFVIHDSSGSQSVGPMRVQSVPTISGSKKRKKQGSPLKTLIGIVLGPVIAIPLAGAILLGADYLGFITAPNLGVWPMDGSYSSSTPSNRTASAPMQSSEQSNHQPSMSNPSTGRSIGEDFPAAESTVDPAADTLAQIQTPELSTTAEDLAPTTAMLDPDTVEVEAPELTAPAITMPNLGLPKALSPVIEPPNVDVSETTDAAADLIPETTPATETKMPAVAETPATPEPAATITSVASPELLSARDQANEMLSKLTNFTGTDAERRPLLASTYSSIAKVGTLLDTSNTKEVDEIVSELKQNETLLSDFARAAPQWIGLGPKKRPHAGVIVVGDLDTTGESPTIRLSDDSVIPAETLDASALSDGRVLGLGTIIDGPNGRSVNLSILESL